MPDSKDKPPVIQKRPISRSAVDGLIDWPSPRVRWSLTDRDKIFLLHIGVMSAQACNE